LLQQRLGRNSEWVKRVRWGDFADLGSFVFHFQDRDRRLFRSAGRGYDYSIGSETPVVLLEEASHEDYNTWQSDTCWGNLVEEVCFVEKGK